LKTSWSIIWRIARRDLSARIRGLRLLAVCLFLGVATLAAIGSLTSGIAAELSNRGQTILGGDIEIETAQREATSAELAALRRQGALSETVRLRAMAIGGPENDSLLAELKAVDQAYPFYGALTLSDGKVVKAPPRGQIYIAPTLANRLSLGKGGTVRFGEATFTIAGIIGEEPDRLGEGFTLGPVAIIDLASLPVTKLIQPGSMFNAKYRIKLPRQSDPAKVAEHIKKQFPSAGFEITDRSNGAPGTRRFIERMGQFLTLVGLAALVIAGIGVGNGVGSYLESKRASIATLKVTGADSNVIFRIYLTQIFVVAALAIIAGLITGSIAPQLISFFIGDILPVPPGFALYPAPLIASALYGFLIALAFALPPLSRARLVPAAGLFRAVVEGGRQYDKKSIILVSAAILAIVALAVATAREPLFSAGFIAAAFGLLLILTGIAYAVRWVAVRLPRPKTPLLRVALANLHRPGAQTQALVVALGLGLTLFVTLATIQTSINNEISRSVPERAPSFFMLDVPRDGADKLRAMVREAAPDAQINMIPALRGRIIAFAEKRVDEMDELPPGAWVLNGDRGLTYSATIPAGSEITAGKYWDADYRGPPLLSMEEEVAASIGVGIGDDITISLLGVEVTAKITSLRKVEWDNFGLNYVMVFSPGSLDAAPHNMVATLTVPEAAKAKLAKAIPPAFPSASLIEVGEVVTQITSLLKQMAQAIAAAASIAILAGIAVLVGAIAASRASRIYDSVILKLLGSTRSQILGAQALEYGVLALLLGILAMALGMGAGWYVIVMIFDFKFAPDYGVLALTLVGGAGITFLLGLLGSLPILAARPAEALRSL
jgi:putative ABC transport system permease protein